MTKYKASTKKQLVELVTKKNYSIGNAAKELGISRSLAGRWIQMYEHHGYEGLVVKSGSYTGKFKIDAVEYMHANNLSIREASAMFGIPDHSTLLNWERTYYEKGAEGLLKDNRGRPRKNMNKKAKGTKIPKETKEDLIEEVQRLRAENAYLKKLQALIQEEEELERKRKRK